MKRRSRRRRGAGRSRRGGKETKRWRGGGVEEA